MVCLPCGAVESVKSRCYSCEWTGPMSARGAVAAWNRDKPKACEAPVDASRGEACSGAASREPCVMSAGSALRERAARPRARGVPRRSEWRRSVVRAPTVGGRAGNHLTAEECTNPSEQAAGHPARDGSRASPREHSRSRSLARPQRIWPQPAAATAATTAAARRPSRGPWARWAAGSPALDPESAAGRRAPRRARRRSSS